MATVPNGADPGRREPAPATRLRQLKLRSPAGKRAAEDANQWRLPFAGESEKLVQLSAGFVVSEPDRAVHGHDRQAGLRGVSHERPSESSGESGVREGQRADGQSRWAHGPSVSNRDLPLVEGYIAAVVLADTVERGRVRVWVTPRCVVMGGTTC